MPVASLSCPSTASVQTSHPGASAQQLQQGQEDKEPGTVDDQPAQMRGRGAPDECEEEGQIQDQGGLQLTLKEQNGMR
jgi:hypothetical protein